MSDERDFINQHLPGHLKIGIVMGGYLDEKDHLMSREELHERIFANQLDNAKLREELAKAKEGVETCKDIFLSQEKEISKWKNKSHEIVQEIEKRDKILAQAEPHVNFALSEYSPTEDYYHSQSSAVQWLTEYKGMKE